jgi:Domain of unknown function (DUF3883)
VQPPEAVLLAAGRWLRLLQRSSVEQAAALVRADAALADLSVTQYAQGLEWLMGIGLVEDDPSGSRLSRGLDLLSPSALDELLLVATLDAVRPPWLEDADLLVRGTADLPQDIAALATMLNVPDDAALLSVAMVHGKIDLERRASIGSAGELELIALLEAQWPGSTRHVAAEHDGFGYDVAFTRASETWHLEVKATTRRGRLVLHLSRHEHEVALRDPAWQLIAVGLDENNLLACLATVSYVELMARAPEDRHTAGRWEAVRYAIGPELLTGGLPFLAGSPVLTGSLSLISSDITSSATGFAWMPSSSG